MARLKCYTNPENCRRDTYDRLPSSGYETAWKIDYLIQIPSACRTVDFYRLLKFHFGFNKLMIPFETAELWKAQEAGWTSEELVIWIYKGVDEAKMIQFDLDRRAVFGNNSAIFSAYYLDEPNDMSNTEIDIIHSANSNHNLSNEFIIGDWGTGWKDYLDHADSVMYSSAYSEWGSWFGSTDQRGAWSDVYNTIGPKANYWIDLFEDRRILYQENEYEDLIVKAKNLDAGGIWLFAGTVPGCNQLVNWMEEFSKIAMRKGMLQMQSGALYLAETYYCQMSDCRECDDKPVYDRRYWGEKPLPTCPKASIPIDPYTQKMRVNRIIGKQHSGTDTNNFSTLNTFEQFIDRDLFL